MIHAFGLNGIIACGKLFPSAQRVSSDKDIGPSDKVTTQLAIVDCPDCRKKLGLIDVPKPVIYVPAR